MLAYFVRVAAELADVSADPLQRQDLVLEAIIAGAVLSIGHQEAEGVQPEKTARRAQIRACATITTYTDEESHSTTHCM